MLQLKNKKHEAFAQAVAGGCGQTEAYRLTVNKNAKGAKEVAYVLRKRPDINRRIEELSAKTEEKISMTKEQMVEIFLKMVKASPDEASMQNPLCDVRVLKDGRKVPVFPNKSVAAERVAKMMGWDKDVTELQASERVLEMVGAFHT